MPSNKTIPFKSEINKKMIGMQYNLQGKSVLEVAGFASSEAKCKKEGSCASNEPISVLDTRRSPSPSTSTSTLSSSFGVSSGGGNGGGGSGSTDNTASLAAVSDDNSNKKWPASLPPETVSVPVTDPAAAGGGCRKDKWTAELQPIPAAVEVAAGGSERFGFGLEDWESLLSESAASPGQDHSLLRLIAGDVEDTLFTLKQLLQGASPNETDSNAALGLIDQSSGFEASAASGSANGNLIASSSLAFSGSGFSLSNNSNAKFGTVQNSSALNSCCNPQNPSFSSSPNNLSLPPGLSHHQQQIQFEAPDQKPLIFNPQVMINHPQVLSTANPNMFSSLSCSTQKQQHQFQPQPKRHNPGIGNSISQIPKVPFIDPGHEFLLRNQQQLPQLQPQPQLAVAHQLNLLPQHLPQKPSMVLKQEAVGGGGEQMAACHQPQQQRVIYDQLYKAAELILAGNFSHAQGILARLNHQLSPVVKPFQRAAFYFKEAMQLPLLMPNPVNSPLPRIPTPFDGMFKMGAYKVLSEISPLVQFMNFTSNQALLEALDDAERIHIIDFDIGFGAQWASFMQELPRRNRGAMLLKITAFASPSTHHPVELGLMHENLTQFANDMGVNIELEVVNFDSFDPNSYSMPPFQSSENEAIAVNFPIWSISSHLSALPSLLRFIKQLSPKIVVSLDRGCERTELPFSHHVLHALQYYEVLFDSIDAVNMTSETTNKIEKFLFQPWIEGIVLGRLYSPEQMPHWKTLFASAGFLPVPLSNIAETQADCLVKRTPVQGFHIEKRQASLVLCWQRQELMSASAWRF